MYEHFHITNRVLNH